MKNMETQTGLKQQESSNTTDKKGSYLIDYSKVEGTPFTIATKEREDSEELEHSVLFGKYLISGKYKTKEEAEADAQEMNWFKIMAIAHAIADERIEAYKLKLNKKK